MPVAAVAHRSATRRAVLAGLAAAGTGGACAASAAPGPPLAAGLCGAVDVSPDGTAWAAVFGKQATLWSASDGRRLAVSAPLAVDIWEIAFAADGSLLGVCDDGGLRRWRAPDLALLATLPVMAGYGVSVAAWPDRPLAAVSGGEDAFRIVDWRDGRIVRAKPLLADERPQIDPPAQLPGHLTKATGLAVSRDGLWLASADDRGVVALWDAATGRFVRLFARVYGYLNFLPARVAGSTALAFSPDGARLAFGSGEEVVEWSVADGAVLSRHRLGDQVDAVDYGPDGRLAAAAWNGDVVLLERSRGGRLRRRWTRAFGVHEVNGLRFHPRGLLAVAGMEGLYVLDPADGKPAYRA